MATTLTSPLPSIHPVYDPLIVSLQDGADLASDREGQSQVEVLLEIEDTLGSDEWRVISEILNPYDYTTDLAKAVLNKALEGALSPFIPDLTDPDAQVMSGPIKRFRIQARDYVDGEAQGELTASAAGRAWLAGNSYVNKGTDLLTGKAYLFLTTRSLTRRLHPSESIHLQVLPVSSGTPTIRIKAYFTDGTDQTDTTALDPATALVPFAYNVTIPAYAKTVQTIEIDITGLTGVAEKLTYKLISNPSPYFRQLFYCNSLGGLDHLPLTGKSQEINTTSGEVFEAQEYPPINAQVGNFKAFNTRSSDSFVLRTGYMTQDEINSLRDLTLRNEVWLKEGTTLRKLILNNSSWKVLEDGNFLHALEFTCRFAWTENAYSR